MALVKLRNDWFAPDGAHYRKDEHGTEVPDDLVAKLPSTAKMLKGRIAAPAPKPPSLKEMDPDRANGDAETAAAEKAETERLANAKRLQEQLAKEKARK